MTWLGLAGLGVAVGVLLGQFAVGGEARSLESHASYAEFSGNPEALAIDAAPAEACFGCFDSYADAIRLRASRQARMDDDFRELGAVAIDHAAEPTEDYDYGGNFDDPAAARTLAMQSPVPIETLPVEADAAPSGVEVLTVPPATPLPAANGAHETWGSFQSE